MVSESESEFVFNSDSFLVTKYTSFLKDNLYPLFNAISFNDISPKAKVHVLVIPKGPYIDIYDFNKNASKEEVVGFWNSVNKTIEKLQIEKKGFRLKAHKGEAGGQEVFHFHVHILSND